MKKTNIIVKISNNGKEYLVSRTSNNDIKLSRDVSLAKKYTWEGARKLINKMKDYGEDEFYSSEIREKL